jgi:hypothetical protein
MNFQHVEVASILLGGFCKMVLGALWYGIFSETFIQHAFGTQKEFEKKQKENSSPRK